MPGLPERFCCDEDLDRIGYDGHAWQSDLEALRRNGPRPATAELIETLRSQGVVGSTIVDIGAGVGAVHLGLLEAGAARAVDVDASRDYQAAARAESERRGMTDRVEYRYGDIVELAAGLPAADVVTADSVVCCYPYLAPFLRAAVSSQPRLLGLILPRDVWWLRAWMRAQNLWWAARRRPDRWFIHRFAEIVEVLGTLGYRSIHRGGTRTWQTLVYERDKRSHAVASTQTATGGAPSRVGRMLPKK